MTKTFSAKLIIKKTRLKSMSQKLWLTTIAFAVILAIPAISKAQYLETFSTPNKGYLLNCHGIPLALAKSVHLIQLQIFVTQMIISKPLSLQ